MEEASTSCSANSASNALKRRKQYHTLLDYGHNLALRTQTDDAFAIFEGVSSMLVETNNLHKGMELERAKNCSEMNINVQIIKMGHDLVGAALQKSESSQFCEEELTAAIKAVVGESGNYSQWMQIGALGVKSFRMSKQSPILLGAFEFQPVAVERTVKERRRRQRQELGDPRKPQTVVKLQQEETDARKLQGIMEQLKSICLQRRKSIPYFELITDPTDYMNTVDTAFQISFLIRDGAVALESVDNVLSVRPTSDTERQQNKRNDDNVQAILSLNYAAWKGAIQKFRLKRPILTIERDLLDASQIS
uniref:Non-structural maintenance of chromosomes element 4 n=1 Tax=Anopheles epiroticus TaxID=199890 RepID=A0A182PYQ7_9DIPT